MCTSIYVLYWNLKRTKARARRDGRGGRGIAVGVYERVRWLVYGYHQWNGRAKWGCWDEPVHAPTKSVAKHKTADGIAAENGVGEKRRNSNFVQSHIIPQYRLKWGICAVIHPAIHQLFGRKQRSLLYPLCQIIISLLKAFTASRTFSISTRINP